MKKLQVLGTGCPKCKKLTENTEAAAKALGIEYELVRVSEVPILQGLIGSGMAKDQALALLPARCSHSRHTGHPQRHGNSEDGRLRLVSSWVAHNHRYGHWSGFLIP